MTSIKEIDEFIDRRGSILKGSRDIISRPPSEYELYLETRNLYIACCTYVNKDCSRCPARIIGGCAFDSMLENWDRLNK